MPYNFVADSFHTKKLCSRLFQAKCDFTRKRPFCVSEPHLGDLGATSDDHLRFTGKHVDDLLLAYN